MPHHQEINCANALRIQKHVYIFPYDKILNVFISLNYRECERDLSLLNVKHILGIKWFNFFSCRKRALLNRRSHLNLFCKDWRR